MITDDELLEINHALWEFGFDHDVMFCKDTMTVIAWDWCDNQMKQLEFKVTEFADIIELVEV